MSEVVPEETPKVVTLGGEAFISEETGPSEVQKVFDIVQENIKSAGGKAIAVCVIHGDGSCTYAQHAGDGMLLALLGATEQLKHKVHAKYNSGDMTNNSGAF